MRKKKLGHSKAGLFRVHEGKLGVKPGIRVAEP